MNVLKYPYKYNTSSRFLYIGSADIQETRKFNHTQLIETIEKRQIIPYLVI